jgi:hypothetical protein
MRRLKPLCAVHSAGQSTIKMKLRYNNQVGMAGLWGCEQNLARFAHTPMVRLWGWESWCEGLC